MAVVRVEIRPTGKKLTNMEHTILEAAKAKALTGIDNIAMRAFVENEIKAWKQRDRYRTAHTHLHYKSNWEMALKSGTVELAIFKTRM